ncbi:MAG: hypothetical protein WCQ67_07070 [Treponema sp.]|jgi:hypothetical protein
MKYTFDKMYLSAAQKNLGTLFQFALCNIKDTPEDFQKTFEDSIVAHQIEIANPNYLCGKSGIELALSIYGEQKVEPLIKKALDEPYRPEAEYWSGWVLSYYQWNSDIPFKKIFTFYSLRQLLDGYHLLHEADISKTVEIMDEARGK